MSESITHIEDSEEKIRESNKRYWESDKGQATLERYRLSDKGREARKRYFSSDKGQAALLRYQMSDKGQETVKRQSDKRKIMTMCAKFLEENPGATPEDFLRLITEESNGS